MTPSESTSTRNGLRKPIEWTSGRVLACGAPATSGNRFPAGIVYAPAPEPKSALLKSAAAMSVAFGLIRRILPRRSFVLPALRRESPIGGRYQPPSTFVVTDAVAGP